MIDMPARARQIEPMRIAYLLSQYPLPTQTFAQSDIAALRQLGHTAAVFTMKPARSGQVREPQVHYPSLPGVLRWPGALLRCRAALPGLLKTIFAALAKSPGTALMALACLPRAAEIADMIVREKYDVVHLFWARHAALVLTMLKQRGAMPVRSVFVGAYDLVADDFIVALAMDAAEIAVSHAEVNRDYLKQIAPPHVATAIIRRGIPLMDHAAEIDRDPAVWITASALVPEKNVEAVIRMFAAARERDRELRLEIYGDGPDRARLEALSAALGCAQAVTFGGHVDRAALFAAMQRASLFVLLSKKASERLPNVVKEAIWAGCYVVSSRSAGIEELLPDAGLGLVIDPDDPAMIVAALSQLATRDLSDEAGRIGRGQAFIAQHFAATTSMAAYAEHWQHLRCTRAAIGGVAPAAALGLS
jgi:glycosyltransferase involved in cell wall biosynthesis